MLLGVANGRGSNPVALVLMPEKEAICPGLIKRKRLGKAVLPPKTLIKYSEKLGLERKRGFRKFLVDTAGPRGGGRLILWAPDGLTAAKWANIRIFSKKRLTSTPKGTEAIVTPWVQKSKKSEQAFYYW